MPGLVIPQVPAGQRRILLRLPNWLGDVIMAAPTVAAIAAARPEAMLIAQTKAPFASLAALLPGVSEALPAGRDSGLLDLRKSRRALRALELDAAVIFPRSTRVTLAPWLARVPVRLGFDGPGRRRLLTHRVGGWRPLRRGHRSGWYATLAEAFGAQPGPAWRFTPPPAALDTATRLLLGRGRRPDRPLVVLEAGASYGPAKCWPARRFGALAAHLLRSGEADVVTIGTVASRPREREVAAVAGPGLIRLAGRTPELLTLAGVLAQANLVVSNDTGPMHVAAALGAPTLALFGATDPVVSGPLGTGVRTLVYDPEPCSPCFLRRCAVEGHPCLSKIGVERVLGVVRRMLRAEGT